MDLATNLISLRKQKGLTQMDLAEKLNVSRQAISRWEVGAAVPSTDNLIVLSNLYGISVDSIRNAGRSNSERPLFKYRNAEGVFRNSRRIYDCPLYQQRGRTGDSHEPVCFYCSAK